MAHLALGWFSLVPPIIMIKLQNKAFRLVLRCHSFVLDALITENYQGAYDEGIVVLEISSS